MKWNQLSVSLHIVHVSLELLGLSNPPVSTAGGAAITGPHHYIALLSVSQLRKSNSPCSSLQLFTTSGTESRIWEEIEQTILNHKPGGEKPEATVRRHTSREPEQGSSVPPLLPRRYAE